MSRRTVVILTAVIFVLLAVATLIFVLQGKTLPAALFAWTGGLVTIGLEQSITSYVRHLRDMNAAHPAQP